jgi:hypothetical protein
VLAIVAVPCRQKIAVDQQVGDRAEVDLDLEHGAAVALAAPRAFHSLCRDSPSASYPT